VRRLGLTAFDYAKELRALEDRLAQYLRQLCSYSHADALSSLVMVDIPIETKDQIDNIFVVTRSKVRWFDRHSAFGPAVSESFARWARPIRIFCHPQLRADLLHRFKGDQEELQRTILHYFAALHAPTTLPLPMPVESTAKIA
jgi:hypothetical protein